MFSQKVIASARSAAALLIFCVLTTHSSNAEARAETVHRGMTPQELIEFAQREGWLATRAKLGRPAVTIQITGKAQATVLLLECDGTGRCMSGVIRRMSYHFLRTNAGHRYLWHWNQKNHGATGFGPNYITLQRHLQFNGVTNTYLREVIGRIWPKASKAFWSEIDHRWKAEKQRRSSGK